MGIRNEVARRTYWMRSIQLTYTCFLSLLGLHPLVGVTRSPLRSVLISTSLSMFFVASKAWPLVMSDLQWFIKHGHGKKMYMDEVSIHSTARLVPLTLSVFRMDGHLSHILA
jgi:hypothetical protein